WVAPAPPTARAAAMLESMWHVTFDHVFRAREEVHAQVWGNSYTGAPLPAEQIADWVARTAENVLALKPRRVLEIGCGDGQIMKRLLPHLESYAGTDLSPKAIDCVKASLAAEDVRRVTLEVGSALDAAKLSGTFDTIVLNSVCQYFPSLD